MSLASEITNAATEAQGILAQIGGGPRRDQCPLQRGGLFLRLWLPAGSEPDAPAGGYRQRTFLSATVTRAQFDALPVAKTKWTRTDLDPNLTYTIDSVGQHDANLLTLTLIRPGE